MRVLCIDAKNNPKSDVPCDLVEGEIYIVVKECKSRDIYGNIGYGYLIQGTDHNFAYPKWRFIPVSDIDETEMVRELQTVKKL